MKSQLERLCRIHTERNIATLLEIAEDLEHHPRDRTRAVEVLLSYGHGKPVDRLAIAQVGDGGQEAALEAGHLAFSLCGTPILYRLGEVYGIKVHMVNEETESIAGARLGRSLSQSLFNREQRVQSILVDIPEEKLR